jgi:hypothetical protein
MDWADACSITRKTRRPRPERIGRPQQPLTLSAHVVRFARNSTGENRGENTLFLGRRRFSGFSRNFLWRALDSVFLVRYITRPWLQGGARFASVILCAPFSFAPTTRLFCAYRLPVDLKKHPRSHSNRNPA